MIPIEDYEDDEDDEDVTWRYLGNQEWYRRSASVNTTGKNTE